MVVISLLEEGMITSLDVFDFQTFQHCRENPNMQLSEGDVGMVG